MCIAPQLVSQVNQMAGSIQTPNGVVSVAYRKKAERVDFTVCIPSGTEAVFTYAGKTYPLTEGENRLNDL